MDELTRLYAAGTDRPGAVRRVAPLRGLEVRDSGAEAGAFTIKGHAAVFNRPCDFGYFTEYIAPGAFQAALSKKPLEVVSNWQHQDRWIFGHTLNKTLELAEDDEGLMQWTRAAPTSYAADARILLDRGDIQQQSFCFYIGAETWEYLNEGEDNEEIRVTITEVKELFDVTICALGAYPQTDVTADSRDRLGAALRAGRVPGLDFDGALARGFVLDPDRQPAREDNALGEESSRPKRAGDAEKQARARDMERRQRHTKGLNARNKGALRPSEGDTGGDGTRP